MRTEMWFPYVSFQFFPENQSRGSWTEFPVVPGRRALQELQTPFDTSAVLSPQDLERWGTQLRPSLADVVVNPRVFGYHSYHPLGGSDDLITGNLLFQVGCALHVRVLPMTRGM